ncbi:hypothetical protein [Lonsdalea quercina]|uniref:hypothetical protein n=1 Tax=Lonsdalea quercina TaxID=71657 RepID=UPI003974D271
MRVAKGKAVPALVHPAAPDRRKHTVQELIAGVLTRLKRIFLLQLAADSNLTTDVGRRRANFCTRMSDEIHCFSVSCKNALPPITQKTEQRVVFCADGSPPYYPAIKRWSE